VYVPSAWSTRLVAVAFSLLAVHVAQLAMCEIQVSNAMPLPAIVGLPGTSCSSAMPPTCENGRPFTFWPFRLRTVKLATGFGSFDTL